VFPSLPFSANLFEEIKRKKKEKRKVLNIQYTDARCVCELSRSISIKEGVRIVGFNYNFS